MRRRSRLVITVAAAVVALCATGAAAARPAGRGSLPEAQSAAARTALPAWAIGPFTRYSGNPILTPPVHPDPSNLWEWPEAFNPSVVVVGGVFHMLYRGAASGNISSIGAATSTDGRHFTEAANNPVIRRTLPSEAQGVEDPRLFYLHGRYYAFFTGYNGTDVGINEATSTDAEHWTQLGRVIPNTKNAAVVANPRGEPVKINGSYWMYYGETGGTYLARSADLRHWKAAARLRAGFPPSWEPYELCVAVTDYPTRSGTASSKRIVLFVAGQLMGHGRWYYAISEVLISRAHMTSLAAKLYRPVLQPQAPYEIYGFTPHTVFMNNILGYRGKWWMYYGAGDSVIALANAPQR